MNIFNQGILLKLFSIFCIINTLSSEINSGSGDWVDLFDGVSLRGWEVVRSQDNTNPAKFYVNEGCIVGVAKLGIPNSFLRTDQTYSDFILEFDVKVEPEINSGVQIRSRSDPSYRGGRVHGYQVELDPSYNRRWSGGIYDEARRGWLYPLTRNTKAQNAFKNGAWNHVRVEAFGTSIRTWMNGVQCSNLVDDMSTDGFIALQVHGIGNHKEKDGLKIRWKDLKIMTSDIESHRKKVDPCVEEISWLVNQLTPREEKLGWRLLFDGKSTKGWRRANDTDFPSLGWTVEDGVLTVLESGGGEATNGGDIVTLDEFSSFELELDFKITEGANSGIKYFVIEGIKNGPGSAIGLEFQILDDKRHPDALKGVNGNRTIGSLYDLITSENLSEPDRMKKRVNPPGRWNKARLVVHGNRVEHWLNNIKVLEYERGSQIFRNLVAKSKYAKYEDFGEAMSGHILLQDHGNQVSFRSIKIREL